VAALLGLVIITVLFGGDDEDSDKSGGDSQIAERLTPADTTTGTTQAPATATAEPVQSLDDARRAVDDDDYAQAVAIAAALSAADANAVRRRIANRIARRVRAAVRAGDRARAKALLAQADRYPTTARTRQARATYKAAKARAAQRARQRRLAAEQRRRDRAAQREAERQRRAAEREQQQLEESSPAAPTGGTCADTPLTDFPVPPGDPRDRDGDGIACES
jgi:hypothetical protein